MPDARTTLIFASAAIPLVLGLLHLTFTFLGPKLTPRDPALRAAMTQVSPVITRETTMWKTWVGFNATHSMSLILFGLFYGYLAARRPDVLFGSPFLLSLGLVTLVAYAVLGKAYFFRVPFRSICVALALYAGGVAVFFLSR